VDTLSTQGSVFPLFSGAYISQKCSVADTFHFDTDPDPGRILTKVQSFEISQLFLKKTFVDFLCLSKHALNTQILEDLEEI